MKDASKDLEKQLDLFKSFLRATNATRTSPQLVHAREWLASFPEDLPEKEVHEINALIRKAFNLKGAAEMVKPREDFDPQVPKSGWFRDYHEYTQHSEAPAVFHYVSAYTIIGATLERNVYFDKGFYRVWPNVAAVLIAPTGRCRKTSATNIALSLARAVDVNVLSERITPEALVQGLHGRETATGLVYAPELAVFLGRQKYLEGMVPLLTSLFDCPDTWKSKTIGRGEAILADVALSFLAASTLEWFVEALPREAFSGGFMSRLLFVVQEDTPREFALPERGEGTAWERLRENLELIKEVQGEATLRSNAKDWYMEWYSAHHKQELADEKSAGYHERKPDHVLRMAMILRIASAESLEIRIEDLEEAIGILDWLESSLPHIFETIAGTQIGNHHQRILRQLRAAGGKMPHSLLLRKNQFAMNAKTFREAIDTLRESECIIEERGRNLEHSYSLADYVKEDET